MTAEGVGAVRADHLYGPDAIGRNCLHCRRQRALCEPVEMNGIDRTLRLKVAREIVGIETASVVVVYEEERGARAERAKLGKGFVEAVLLVCGHQQRGSRYTVEAKLPDELCAPSVWKAVVHEQHVDVPSPCERERLRCGHGDAGEADRGVLEGHANPARDHRVVLDEENGQLSVSHAADLTSCRDRNASTTSGSNWLPVQRLISSRASSIFMAAR